eukprot:CAMPEP_0176481324 /NCGR_PEP_ID=MMETSP0200_2-20121128/2757_1 /TAXON_ID=947934 /ORGANISM="Chaetoceros sp., Strain GSL56" /LENGTH=726 /DNA_ID=CAMNT_0017877517 /DNA_START=207 /DNA_END=2387 /DNA_ORIENTATION=+
MSRETSEQEQAPGAVSQPYIVRVSRTFIYISLLTSILLAFTIGRAARIILMKGPRRALLAPHDTSAMFVRPEHARPSLPHPQLIVGKEVPRTLYTAKNFDTAMGASTASVYLEKSVDSASNSVKVSNDQKSDDGKSFCKADQGGDKTCSRGGSGNSVDIIAPNNSDAALSGEEAPHLPAGQHLLVDIKNVDGTFLNSELRLAQAMVDVVNQSKLTLLSYHCHKLIPMGVSCVGVLLESHISFHTWPEEGVITLDLFTCGSGELVPVLPIIEELFAIPIEDGNAADPPQLLWSHKLRGFNPEPSVLGDDLGQFVLERSQMDLKVEVASTKTKFQRIDIYDSIDSSARDYLSYMKSLDSKHTSYESLHPELFLPEREVYLDGVLQSTRYGNEPYHEALVHPSMFSHPNPKRVGIIGGGEGATLREVLKHKSIEVATMIEIDEEMVSFSRKHLPDWNTCSDIKGSAEWCGDDTRARIFYEDGVAWFHDRFSDEALSASNGLKEERFDVLIMDALDPQDNVPFADILYTNEGFIKTLCNALTDNGIIIMQLGESAENLGPPEEISRNSKRSFVMHVFERIGFTNVHVYEEGNCHFRGPWSYAVAMKSNETESLWYRSSAEIDVEVRKRILPTVSGKPALKNFDGTLMESYQNPPKSFELVYCRATPVPDSCKYLLGHDKIAITPEGRKLYDPIIDRHSPREGGICDYVSYVMKRGHRYDSLPQEVKMMCN